MPSPPSCRPFILWIEWQGFYADDHLEGPEVVVRDRQVLDANLRARARGVVPGMDVPQVRNLADGCVIRDWRPEDTANRTRDWLDRCLPFTGRIEPIDGHIAALDLSGHPRPAQVAARIIERLDEHPCGRLAYGTGPSKWIAQLSALKGQPAKRPAEFLSPLPVDLLLPVDPAHRRRLEFLGYRSIGEVAKLPLDVLQDQFGTVALEISGAARGSGGEPLRAVYPPDVVGEAFPFVECVEDALVIRAAWERLADRLAERLVGKQAGEIALEVEWEDGIIQRQTRRPSRSLYDRAGLLATIRSLETLRPDREGGVVGLSAQLTRIEPFRPRQGALLMVKERPSVDRAVQSLREAYGERTVVLASRVEVPRRERVLREWRLATGWC